MKLFRLLFALTLLVLPLSFGIGCEASVDDGGADIEIGD